MTNTFYISDTHFCHKRIIEMAGRPFVTINEMNETLIRNWNSVVTPEDTVIHLGDFAFAGFQVAHDIMVRLNGYKILVKGNHDGTNVYMLRVGFNEIVKYMVRDNVIMIHNPIEIFTKRIVDGSMTLEERYRECDYVFHGHVHEKFPNGQIEKGINCCVEHHGYIPKTFEQLIATKNPA